MLNSTLGVTILGIIIFGGIAIFIYFYLLPAPKSDYEKYMEDYKRKVDEQIAREKKAKERKEKAKRYWEGYDD